MKMLRRSVCLLLCAALFLTLLAGCGKQEEPAEDFVVSAAVCGPLETLDPTMNTDVGAESLLSTLFEGLMRMRDDGAGKAVAVAGIAKEYIEEKNYDDTVTYTFTLRSAARWSDGERVTAEDFVYAWQRLVDPATASPNASLLSMVAGYDEVRESGDVSLLGVKAKGESTFLVTLSRPCAYFITSVCTLAGDGPAAPRSGGGECELGGDRRHRDERPLYRGHMGKGRAASDEEKRRILREQARRAGQHLLPLRDGRADELRSASCRRAGLHREAALRGHRAAGGGRGRGSPLRWRRRSVCSTTI